MEDKAESGFGGGNAYYNNVEVTSNGIVYATLSSDGTDKGLAFGRRNKLESHTTHFLPQIYGRAAIVSTHPTRTKFISLLLKQTAQSVYQYLLMDKHGLLCINTPTYVVMVAILVVFGKIYRLAFLQTDPLLLITSMPKVGMTYWLRLNQTTQILSLLVEPTYGDQQTASNQIATPPRLGGITGSYHGRETGIFDTHHPDQHDFAILPSDPMLSLVLLTEEFYKSNNCLATPQYLGTLKQRLSDYPTVFGID